MHIKPSNKYHLIGICGDGMSALAAVLLEMGAEVVGSDIQENERCCELRRAGAEVYIGHKRSNLARDTDVVITSSAIPEDNPELLQARDRNIPVHKRLTALADLMNQKEGIGVAGTHGKSTTTTMAATLLELGGYDPTYLIVAECDKLGGNSKLGQGEHFIAEVDESDGYFLQVEPKIGVVTNIGNDHLDTYKDLDEIIDGFQKFIQRTERPIICADGKHSKKLLKFTDDPFTFGIDREADLRGTNLRQKRFETHFDLTFKGKNIGTVKLPAPGKHNVYNALAAMSICHKAGIKFKEMRNLIEELQLPKRRFQILEKNGSVIIDDYAHLPKEIEVTLEAIKEGWDPERMLAVFQPHRFSRTKHINGQFGDSFQLADQVIITGIYPASEQPIPGITSQLILSSVEKQESVESHRILDRAKIRKFLKKELRPGDFLVGLGAGDIWKTTHDIAQSRQKAEITN